MDEGERCRFPRCEETENLVGLGAQGHLEHYCADHAEYGVGRVFGALHRALERAAEQALGQTGGRPSS